MLGANVITMDNSDWQYRQRQFDRRQQLPSEAQLRVGTMRCDDAQDWLISD
tara:strand:- start:142 stop:294 length:153 start_codon:yes stop_codon:yes gene_type:complete